MEHTVTILMTEFVTHDVKRFIVSRPVDFAFQPGQGVELAINCPAWETKKRPFTPTSLAADRVVEFTIKGYPSHAGVTRELHGLEAGDELLMSGTFGTITYQGPGTFIAGGAGVTPFIAILRELERTGKLDGHRLLFSNKTPADVICEKEFRQYLGKRCLLTCTDDNAPGYDNRRIDRAYLSETLQDFDQHFYVCGPPTFTRAICTALQELGANPDALVFER
jgi:ferredoxin-NADP reductase